MSMTTVHARVGGSRLLEWPCTWQTCAFADVDVAAVGVTWWHVSGQSWQWMALKTV